MSVAACEIGDSLGEKPRKLPPFTDKYEVERVIGRGGMGTVFEARHTRLGQRVAIKVLGNELRVHPELVKRFEREARAAGALSSPYAVRVFDIDQTDDGTPFIVMELLSGRDLANVIENDGAQDIGFSCRCIVEASDAIAEAHRLGIIHRDIKPSNLLLCDSGIIKVLDFGIAKRLPPRGANGEREAAITQGVAPLGTPQYMSPEQVRCAKDVDARSDIWSLGVTLYELLTGRPPYNHDIAQACIAAIVADPVPDPRMFREDIPADLADAILRALSKEPTERFPTVDLFVEAIKPFADASVRPISQSGSHRAFTGAGVQSNDTTLDGDGDLVMPLLKSPPPPPPPMAAARRRAPSEETVPPAVSRASVSTARGQRFKRVRSSLAIGAAAALGLVALVATPKCVGSHLDAAAASQARSALVSVTPANLPATTDVVVAPTPAEPPPAPVVAKTAPPPSTHAIVAAPKVVKASGSNSNMRVRVVGSDRPVHGGISNPGF